jgi:hypothetical protein
MGKSHHDCDAPGCEVQIAWADPHAYCDKHRRDNIVTGCAQVVVPFTGERPQWHALTRSLCAHGIARLCLPYEVKTPPSTVGEPPSIAGELYARCRSLTDTSEQVAVLLREWLSAEGLTGDVAALDVKAAMPWLGQHSPPKNP